MIRTLLKRTALVAALGLAAPALAGPDSMWVNPGGGLSGLRVSDDPVTPLTPGTKTPADIVAAFDRLCVQTDFEKLAVTRAFMDLSGWGGPYQESWLQMNSGAVDLGGWQGDDHFVGILDHPVFSPNPQCIVAVATAQHYPAARLFPVLVGKYGNPDNYDALVAGTDERPFWTLSQADGRERVLFPRSLSSGNTYRIHLALLEREVTGQ